MIYLIAELSPAEGPESIVNIHRIYFERVAGAIMYVRKHNEAQRAKPNGSWENYYRLIGTALTTKEEYYE